MLRRDSDKNEALVNYQDIVFGKILGSGGFGEVYHGTWRHNDVAIKKLLMKQITAESAQEFETESQIMARLRSPNIVQFYGYAIEPERCIVMEYCPNGSLYSVLHSNQPLEWSERTNIALGTAKGLAFLHEEKILHRDIKSLNVLLTKHFEAKLTDFGLSKLKTETKSHTLATKTNNKDSVGTIQWMAPELFRRNAQFTQKSDIYSLGVTFWELASRKVPFSEALDASLIKDWVKDGERETIPQDCPSTFGSLIQACWTEDPSARPDTNTIITQLKKSVEAFSTSKTSNAPSPNPSPFPAPSGPQYLSNLVSEEAPKPLVFSPPSKPLPPPPKPPAPINTPRPEEPQIAKESPKNLLLNTLKGHADWVNCLQPLPSGELVSGSHDKTLKVWDLRTGACLKTLKGHADWVNCLQPLPSGELVSGSHDKTLKVWDLRRGKCLKTLKGHAYAVCCLQLIPGGELVSGSADNTLKVWDLRTGACLKTLKEHANTVYCLQLLPSGELVSGSEDMTLKVWNLRTGTCLKTLEGHVNSIHCLQLLPSGELVTGSTDRSLKVWDLKTGKCLKTLEGHSDRVSCLQPLPSGELVSGSEDRTLKVWDLRTGTCLKTLEGHTGFRCLQLLPSGELVSGSSDGTIKVWDLTEFSLAPAIEEKKAQRPMK